MTAATHHPVLIVGGSGFVGAQTAQALRRLHPELPIAIGGRNLDKARAVAEATGHASAVQVDLARPDLGLPARARFSAVVMFVYDDTLNALRYAQVNRLPYLSFSTGIHEIGPEIARYAHHQTAPVLLASGWLAGGVAMAIMSFAKAFESVDSIEIAGLLDEQDLGGPAAEADFHRLTLLPHTQVLEEGHWRWVPTGDQGRSLRAVDGRQIAAQTYSPFDAFSLPAATGAKTVRFEFALAETSSRLRGEPPSTEVVVEIAGQRREGGAGRTRYELVHPQGQAPVTSLAVALSVERLLGLAGGAAVGAGLYFPESLVDPDYALERLKAAGLQVASRQL